MRPSHLLCAIVLAMNAAPKSNAAPRLVEPPFVRKWTQTVGENAAIIAVRDGLVYYYSGSGVGALDLVTGEPKWASLPHQSVSAAAILGGTLYALAKTEDKKGALDAVDLQTGQSRTLAQLPGAATTLAVDSTHIYILNESGTLQAYNPVSGAILWSHTLPRKPYGWISGEIAPTSGGVFAAIDEVGEFGIDPKDGRILWSHLSKDSQLDPPLVIGGDVIATSGGLKRLTVRSGNVVWKTSEGDGAAVLVANTVINGSDKALVGRNATDGRVLWRVPFPNAANSDDSPGEHVNVSDGQSIWLDRDPVIDLTPAGHVLWRRQKPFSGAPAYSDHERVVTVDAERIFGYVAGTLPPLPTTDAEKQALAQRLAAEFEVLDDAEREQIEKLAPYSFQPLLARFVGWVKAEYADPRGENSGTLYTLAADAQPILAKTFQRQDTAAALAALPSLNGSPRERGEIEQIVHEKGNSEETIPILVENLRKLPLKSRDDSPALEAVAHSSRPEAVALMLEALRDPKAAFAWRQLAFRHLAGTGGPEGVQAVREARARRAPQKPWFDRIDLSKLSPYEHSPLKKDAKGRTWMLFSHYVMGNEGDVFIVQKLGSKWGRPVFTGVWTNNTFGNEAPKSFRGIPLAKLLKTDWIRIFPDDATIRRDSDGDGLTDIVERRLGTNPWKPDTDGDGLSDLVDPCPNAAPRPLADTEKIIAASIEARFFMEDWNVPAILSVPGVKPFEMYGYPSTLLWETPEKKIPLSRLYGGGVNLIDFYYPDENRRQTGPFIQFSPDHKTAHTIISRYSGGLNGDGTEVTLKKIGDDWFVVDMQRKWVS